MTHPPKAILFDLDDTLISFDGVSVPVWQACCAETVARFHLPVSPQALWDAVRARKDWFWSDPERHRIGRLDNGAAQRGIVADAMAGLGLEDTEAAHFLADSYAIKRQEAVCLFPRSLETLAVLRTRGVRLALLTNGTAGEQRRKIERFGLEPYFERILIEGELGFGKPDRRFFLLALEQMGLLPREAWMVGDNLSWEIVPARELGLTAIWNDWRGAGLPEGSTARPHRIIRDVGELLW